jgi:hypothetical protein
VWTGTADVIVGFGVCVSLLGDAGDKAHGGALVAHGLEG